MVKFLLGMVLGVALTIACFFLVPRPSVDPGPTFVEVKSPKMLAAQEEAKRAASEGRAAVAFAKNAPEEAEYDSEANLDPRTMVESDIGNNLTLGGLAPDNSHDYTIQSGRGPDGYRVDKATMDHDTISLRIYKYRSEAEFRRAIKAAGQTPDTEGLSYFSKGTNECVILVRDPAFRYQPITLGHELTHCIYGDFHDDDYPS